MPSHLVKARWNAVEAIPLDLRMSEPQDDEHSDTEVHRSRPPRTAKPPPSLILLDLRRFEWPDDISFGTGSHTLRDRAKPTTYNLVKLSARSRNSAHSELDKRDNTPRGHREIKGPATRPSSRSC